MKCSKKASRQWFCNFGLGYRHGQVILMFFGVVIAYALRANLALALVAMEKENLNKTVGKVHFSANSSDPKGIDLNGIQKGTVLGAFFVGYTFLQIPAGTFARKYGTCIQLSIAIALSGIATIITPIVTIRFSWIGLTIARMFTGLFQGFLYPCVNQHLTKWAPPQERNRLFAFTFGGSIVGNGVMSCAGGFLAAGPGGWPSIFYVSGSIAVMWGILCGILGFNSPREHKYISEKECFFIEHNQIGQAKNNSEMETPWKEIWTSVPFWALLLTFLGNIWGFYTLLNMTPSYINDVLNFPLTNNGVLSALPYIAMWIFNITFSILAEYMINKGITSIEVSRKMWNSISQYGPGVCLLILAFCRTSHVSAIALLTVSSALNSAMYIGYLMNPTDLSPNFTGTLMGLANGFANITAILGPLVSSLILNQSSDHQEIVKEWRIVFTLTAAIYFTGSTIFLIFGSTKIQPWNEPKKSVNVTSYINSTVQFRNVEFH